MTTPITGYLTALTLSVACVSAQAQIGSPPTRGQLLYDTHCVACHDTQMHWRQNRKARDWKSLVTLVRHWQAAENLGWNEQDVTQVARHLNDTIYRYPVAGLAQRDKR